MSRAAQICLFAVILLFLGQRITYGQLFLADQAPTNGISVTVAWDPSSDTNAVGYFIYYGTSPETCTNRLNAGPATSSIVGGFEAGTTYYFVVTAYDSFGQESPPSNEIVYTAQAANSAPITLNVSNSSSSGITIKFQADSSGTYQIQSTRDFQLWETIWTTNSAPGTIVFPVPNSTTNSHLFFRMVKS